jgi:hypothetical protein
MGVVFQGDERQDFVSVVEEVTEGVEDLGLGEVQGLGNLEDGSPRWCNVTTWRTATANRRLPAHLAFESNDMRVFGFHRLRHCRGATP